MLWSLDSRVIDAARRGASGALLTAHSRRFSCDDCLAGRRIFALGLRYLRCLPQFSSRRGSDALRVAGSSDAALGGQPRGRLAAGASLEGPAALSSAAAFDRLAFGGPRLASACSFTMASLLRVSFPRQPSIAKSPLCSSALELAGQAFSRRPLWWNSGESPD
ncbi:hypothetical protein MTO96_044586 [Rhipicephalus appendiculatus]